MKMPLFTYTACPFCGRPMKTPVADRPAHQFCGICLPERPKLDRAPEEMDWTARQVTDDRRWGKWEYWEKPLSRAGPTVQQLADEQYAQNLRALQGLPPAPRKHVAEITM